ncbi:retrotransposon hot spot (RHS) protein [Trypanosoma cruzi]|nr:retrotransposon hot spot (RHS) protein [Trypanosoma cruzi]RNC52120.1 retrotransposon hot spot (RHS) protein [Trypanosoma cruzi]
MRAVIPCFLACVVALMLCVRMATVGELNTVQCMLLTGTARYMYFLLGGPKEGRIAVACFPRQSITLRMCMPPSAAPLQAFAFVRNGERDCCGGGRMFPNWCFC